MKPHSRAELRPDATPLHRHIFYILHNPTLPSEGGRLQEVLGWNDPDKLVRQFIKDLRECSHGMAEFEVVEEAVVDEFPPKADGFVYSPQTYLQSWRARSGFHRPDGIDYLAVLEEHDIVARIDSGEIDEVWMMGFPYAGYYESIMAGPGAFWCNAPPLSVRASRRFVIMGFNFERGGGEMLESFGHRAESIMARVFAGTQSEANLWERFTRCHKTHGRKAEVGTIHFAPNSEQDYDWGNPRPVPSRCDAWLTFPELTGREKLVDNRTWGGGDIRLHHMWWFRCLPHVAGEANGIAHNWWQYILDPGKVPA